MPRCPACSEKVSSNDDECPHCGEPMGAEESKPRKRKGGKSKGSGGSNVLLIVLGVVAVGLLGCGGILAALLFPAVSQAREAARMAQCRNNLKQIGLGLHNYHDVYGAMPAAHLNDVKGEPKLSWRVSILPFIDEAPRYNLYSFNDAWDAGPNAPLLNPLPMAYGCPAYERKSPTTCYAAITGESTVLGAGKCVKMAQITDGTSNTLAVVEACKLNIPWMKPQDIDATTITSFGTPDGASGNHKMGIPILMTDGSVRVVQSTLDPATVKALISRNGNEQILDSF